MNPKVWKVNRNYIKPDRNRTKDVLTERKKSLQIDGR